MISRPNGRVQDSCAPRAEVYQSVFQPEQLEHQADADAQHIAGRDKADERGIKQEIAAGKGTRNAMPTATETTTVIAITITASGKEREIAPCRSPVSVWESRSRTSAG